MTKFMFERICLVDEYNTKAGGTVLVKQTRATMTMVRLNVEVTSVRREVGLDVVSVARLT